MSSKYIFIYCGILLASISGCKSPSEHRIQMDKTAQEIIEQKQAEALGEVYPFSVDRPGDILRRKLIEAQNLIISSDASLGPDRLKPIEFWPEDGYPAVMSNEDHSQFGDLSKPLTLNLSQSLQIAARNNFTYQDNKEDVFRAALLLDLERNEFRNFFFGSANTAIQSDTTTGDTHSATRTSGDASVSRLLKNGALITAGIGIDVVNLLTGSRTSSLGLIGDASVTIPLLSGSGRHIVTEPLKQSERNVVYAIWDFERYRKEFAVEVASEYISVLRRLDAVTINQEDYRSRIASARRSRRLADAGCIQQIEVDQAIQNELSSRQRWISSMESYNAALDSFKRTLGLPPDARIELDPNALSQIVSPLVAMARDSIQDQEPQSASNNVPSADAPVELQPPDTENAGPLELDEQEAIKLALENRLDFYVTQGRVYDAQRTVVVAADALGADLSLVGSMTTGSSRSITSGALSDSQLRLDRALYAGSLTLDLPFERTGEAINYRNSFLNLDRACRDVQVAEDQIKLQIRSLLRNMLRARENLYIQANAVQVAEKRVRSTTLFLEAGRAQMRDLLEAQDSLLSARINLTSAAVDYRIAEWEMRRDLGVLKIDENGLWKASTYMGNEVLNG